MFIEPRGCEEEVEKQTNSVLTQISVGRKGKTPDSAFPSTVLRGFLDIFLPHRSLEWRDTRSVADRLKHCRFQFHSSCSTFVYYLKEISRLV